MSINPIVGARKINEAYQGIGKGVKIAINIFAIFTSGIENNMMDRIRIFMIVAFVFC